MPANRRGRNSEELERLITPKARLVTPGQWVNDAPENVVIIDDRLVSKFSSVDPAIRRIQLFTASITTLQESPFPRRAQCQVSVLKHTIVAKEWIEPQTGFIDFTPPHSAGSSHKVHISDSTKRRLHVGVDGIAGLKVVAARLINRQQSQPAIPPPALAGIGFEVAVRAITDNASHFASDVLIKDLQNVLEEFRLQPDIIVDEGDVISRGLLNSGISLNGSTS